jgi:hypothetical protein
MNTASVGNGWLRIEDARAAMTARSAAGSCIFRPPAMLTKMSCPAALIPAQAPRVETGGDALRQGVGSGRSERLDFDEQRPGAFDGCHDR